MWVFFFRLFRTCDNIHECDYANGNTDLDSHISSAKLAQAKINKEKSWNCGNSKQKLQYSTNKLKGNDTFSASGIGENIFTVPSFSVASQPCDSQGNSYSVAYLSAFYENSNQFAFLSIRKNKNRVKFSLHVQFMHFFIVALFCSCISIFLTYLLVKCCTNFIENG